MDAYFYQSWDLPLFFTIHPWMEGVVSVQGGQAQNIPNYPVDDSGKRISKLPIYHFTPDGQIEVGLTGILTFCLQVRRYLFLSLSLTVQTINQIFCHLILF